MSGKKVNRKTVFKTVLGLLALAAISVAQAQPIMYADEFTGVVSDPLSGTAPDTRPRAETWTADAGFKADGSFASAANASAYLPLTPIAGKTYRISVDVSGLSSATGVRWAGIGFGTSVLGINQTVIQNSRGVAALILRVNGQVVAFRDGATAVTNGTGYGTAQTLSLVLTTHADSTPWTVDYYVGAAKFASYAWATGGNPGIASVAISSNGDDLTGNIDQFSVEGEVPLRIMPLGDSITVGFTDNPGWTHPFEFGYRSGLYTRLKNAGYEFVFAGSSKEPFTNPDRFGDPTHGGTVSPTLDLREFNQNGHHGHAAFGIEGIEGYVVDWINQEQPDIILLLIGINGISAESPQQLDSLVQTIYDTDEEVALIVAQIPPAATYKQVVFDYNTYIRETLVPKYAGNGYTISIVDQYTRFLTDPEDPQSIDATRFSNGINHPTNPLYDQMAERWFDGIELLLNPAPPQTRIYDLTLAGETVMLSISNLASGFIHEVERCFDLRSNDWTTVEALDVTGTDTTWAETIDPSWMKVFYRVKSESEGHE